MPWPPGRSRSPIGIDTDGHSVCAAQLRREGGRWRLEATASVPRVDDDGVFGSDDVARLIDVLERRGFSGRSVVVAVPDDDLMTDVLNVATPAGSTDGLAGAVRAELARSHRRPTESLESAYWPLPRPSRGVDTTAVMAVGCAHETANAFVDLFANAGLTVRGLDVRPCALARVGAAALAGTTGLSMILDLAWHSASLVVVLDTVVVYERRLAAAGLESLHAGVAKQGGLRPDVVDYILSEIGLEESRVGSLRVESRVLQEVQGAIVGHLDQVTPMLKSSLAYASQEYPDSPIGRLLLVGEGAEIPGVEAHLATVPDMEATVLTPGDAVRTPVNSGPRRDPQLCAAVGLALYEEGRGS